MLSRTLIDCPQIIAFLELDSARIYFRDENDGLAAIQGAIIFPAVSDILQYFNVDHFRNVCLKCLTEIACLQIDAAYDPHFVKLYTLFMQQLRLFLSADTGMVSNSYHA